MKPAITIKTVKGHKYFQLRNTEGQLIHLGPLNKKESWKLAYTALDEEYSALAFRKMFSLENVAQAHGIDLCECLNGVDDDIKQKYYEMAKLKYAQNQASRALFKDWTLKDDPAKLGDVFEEAETDFEAHKRAAEVTGVSVKKMIFVCSKEGFHRISQNLHS